MFQSYLSSLLLSLLSFCHCVFLFLAGGSGAGYGQRAKVGFHGRVARASGGGPNQNWYSIIHI